MYTGYFVNGSLVEQISEVDGIEAKQDRLRERLPTIRQRLSGLYGEKSGERSALVDEARAIPVQIAALERERFGKAMSIFQAEAQYLDLLLTVYEQGGELPQSESDIIDRKAKSLLPEAKGDPAAARRRARDGRYRELQQKRTVVGRYAILTWGATLAEPEKWDRLAYEVEQATLKRERAASGVFA